MGPPPAPPPLPEGRKWRLLKPSTSALAAVTVSATSPSLGEEEERQVACTMAETAADAAAAVAATARNAKIFEESRYFDEERQERLRAYAECIAHDAAKAGAVAHSSGSSFRSSSSASY